jgi:hypothetical protein
MKYFSLMNSIGVREIVGKFLTPAEVSHLLPLKAVLMYVIDRLHIIDID